MRLQDETRTEIVPMVKPKTEPARMQRRINDVVHPKNLALLVGRGADQVRRWARDEDDADPESTGQPGPLALMRVYFRVLAIHGEEGRAAAVELREWLNREADEALGIEGEPTSLQRLVSAAADTMREASEAVAAAMESGEDPSRARREIAEAIAALETLGRLVPAMVTPLRKVG